MTEIEQWFADNDRYLAAALAWLRARLEYLAALASSEVSVIKAHEAQPQTSSHSRFAMVFGSGRTKKDSVPLLDHPDGATKHGFAPIPAEMIQAEAAPRPPALLLLAARLGLSEFERHTLLLCAAMELDTRIGSLCARAQRDPALCYPTFALALSLFDQPAWDVLSPERPLRRWRLLEINQAHTQPLISSALRADERIVNYLRGLNYLDDRIASLMKPVPLDEGSLPPSQMHCVDAMVHTLENLDGNSSLPIFQLLGADSQSKLMSAQRTAVRAGVTLYRMQAEAIPAANNDYEVFMGLLQRERALLPMALYVDAAHIERNGNLRTSTLTQLLLGNIGLVFLDTREPWPDISQRSILIDVAKPLPDEQFNAWQEVLGAGTDEAVAEALSRRLSGQFNFNVTTIRSIAAAALKGDSDSLAARLWQDCLARTRPNLDQLAQPLQVKARWDDIELPVAEKNMLRQLAEQVSNRSAVYDTWGFRERMNRGFGISALFAGESGTGKTMAAEAIANELGLLLYRIDLSAVVSKYIGETEKNLRKLFDAAEDGGAILFFDEADALFGKRSEVKDSHDRYANIEINYLLQRMESYGGLAILATNMKAALDSAFLRRLRFVVNFPFPGLNERKAIWQKAFPAASPVATLDYERLAKFNLTGGSIHNVVLNAAFLAARNGARIGMPQIFEAMRGELKKLERPINEADFRWCEAVEVSA